ncbi:MAG: helix-turn-helix domain-containing protein [Terrimicrobiaceae bacterium]
MSPVEYRNTSRIEQTKTLLRDTNLTIAEIAYQVGFQDAGYFFRQFRKLTCVCA